MKKLIIIIMALIAINGCGITNGQDGSNGYSGIDGRDYETPVTRPYVWDLSGTVVNFSDVQSGELKLLEVGLSLLDDNNFLIIRVPEGNIGKRIKVVINGYYSEVIMPTDGSDNVTFITTAGIGTDTIKYMNCERLDKTNRYSYFAWYLNGIQQEFYYCDSFK